MECFESAVPAIFLSYAPTFFINYCLPSFQFPRKVYNFCQVTDLHYRISFTNVYTAAKCLSTTVN